MTLCIHVFRLHLCHLEYQSFGISADSPSKLLVSVTHLCAPENCSRNSWYCLQLELLSITKGVCDNLAVFENRNPIFGLMMGSESVTVCVWHLANSNKATNLRTQLRPETANQLRTIANRHAIYLTLQ